MTGLDHNAIAARKQLEASWAGEQFRDRVVEFRQTR